jgi:Ca2+-binding EF-hand superfamily protein
LIFQQITVFLVFKQFFIFSTDNGFLTIETLKGILLELEPNLPDEDLAQIVEEVDEDGSGTIDFDGTVNKPNLTYTNLT